jgi:tRNA-dihydrouridine synthase A
MRRPERVAEAVAAMRAAVAVPVTVKHRLGVDDDVGGEFAERFVDTVAAAGCDRFTVHARAALLCGLSPAQNRQVPPLRHEDVHALAASRPDAVFELNGGVTDLDCVVAHLRHVDAVMVGRAWWDDPWRFRGADALLFGAPTAEGTRADAAREMVAFASRTGTPAHLVARSMLNLFAGVRGARTWRRALSATALGRGATGADLQRAVEAGVAGIGEKGVVAARARDAVAKYQQIGAQAR